MKLKFIFGALLVLIAIVLWNKRLPFGADFNQPTEVGSSPTFNKITFNKATSTESVTIGNLLEVVGTGTSTIAGLLGLGTTTPYLEFGIKGDVAIGGAVGTATISAETTTSGKGGCIELRSQDGTWIRLYAGTAGASTTDASVGKVLGYGGVSLIVGQGRCQTGNE